MNTENLLTSYSAYAEKGEIRLRIPTTDEWGTHICEHVLSSDKALALIADLQRCFSFANDQRPHDCRFHRAMNGECFVCGSSEKPNSRIIGTKK
jgi:hypothetical protein